MSTVAVHVTQEQIRITRTYRYIITINEMIHKIVQYSIYVGKYVHDVYKWHLIMNHYNL